MRFLDYAINRSIMEAKAKKGTNQDGAQQVASEFQQARTELASLVRQTFQKINDKLHHSFGSVSKIDSLQREKFAQTLTAIATRLRSMGDEGAPDASPVLGGNVEAAVEHQIQRIDNILSTTELYLEDDSHNKKIRTVGEYLRGAEAEIMKSVDKILQSLQRDMLQQSISGISDTLGGMSGQVGDLHRAMEVPPLTPEERENLNYALTDICRILHIEKAKFGGKNNNLDGIKIFAGPRKPLQFDPTDMASINTAMEKIENPRKTRIMVDGKPYMINLTNNQEVANFTTMIRSRNPAPTPRRRKAAAPVQLVDPMMQQAQQNGGEV